MSIFQTIGDVKMKHTKQLARVSIWSVLMLLGLGVFIPQAESASVEWKRIDGVIIPGNGGFGLNVVGGVSGPGFSWSTTNGQAKLNLQNGRFSFDVQGLVLASGTGSLVIGTPSPFVTDVKGTIVCNTTDLPNVVLVDTDSVPLSPQGDANFVGDLSLPGVCEDMAFLIRIANPGPILDRWIAHGAVRIP